MVQVIERKGLDIVRRDWSLLSKEIGDFCLSQILSGGYVFFELASTDLLVSSYWKFEKQDSPIYVVEICFLYLQVM